MPDQLPWLPLAASPLEVFSHFSEMVGWLGPSTAGGLSPSDSTSFLFCSREGSTSHVCLSWMHPILVFVHCLKNSSDNMTAFQVCCLTPRFHNVSRHSLATAASWSGLGSQVAFSSLGVSVHQQGPWPNRRSWNLVPVPHLPWTITITQFLLWVRRSTTGSHKTVILILTIKKLRRKVGPSRARHSPLPLSLPSQCHMGTPASGSLQFFSQAVFSHILTRSGPCCHR